jgi:pimeloyl-ACP methyl ester carboxylesterase
MLIETGSLTIDVQERGRGNPIVLLHSAGLGAAQWRALTRELAGGYRCLAPNQRGYGRSSPWPEGAAGELAAELALVEAVLATLPPPTHLVGHSMGAWLALHLLRREPARFASAVLIEPVAIGVLRSEGEAAALAEVGSMIEDVLAAFARADISAAMTRFTDYWYGAGAWAKIPEAQRLPIFARAGKMRADVEAVWRDATPLGDYRAGGVPVLVLSAGATTPAARRMAELIAGQLPAARFATLSDAGHMAPMTHAPAVAAALRAHFETAGRG